jgi:hypothetical protein
MTGDEFRTIRFKLGLSGLEWSRALGYSGEPNSVRNLIRRYEVPQGRKIPPPIERGSVRGARGNSRPYRDRRKFITLLGGAADVVARGARATGGTCYRVPPQHIGVRVARSVGSGGRIVFNGSLGGTGSMVIKDGGTLEVAGNDLSDNVSFAGVEPCK